jgi:cupin fold WbuC family metalloprotein
MKVALESPVGPVHVLTEERLEEGIRESRLNGRGRIIIPIQRSEQAPVQRLVNVLQPGSYVRPHYHPRPQAVELICILRGRVNFVVFDETGRIEKSVTLQTGSAPTIMDIEPMVWHTIIALEPDSVILEIKGGPYDRVKDKVFADWAPEEGSPEADSFLRSMASESCSG